MAFCDFERYFATLPLIVFFLTQEREVMIQKHREEVREKMKQRRETFGRLNRRTRKGQPIMANQIEHLLGKIQSQSERWKSDEKSERGNVSHWLLLKVGQSVTSYALGVNRLFRLGHRMFHSGVFSDVWRALDKALSTRYTSKMANSQGPQSVILAVYKITSKLKKTEKITDT